MRVKSVTVLPERQDVYNMEVDTTHNLVIDNGIVAHNCIDSLRYSLADIKKGTKVKLSQESIRTLWGV